MINKFLLHPRTSGKKKKSNKQENKQTKKQAKNTDLVLTLLSKVQSDTYGTISYIPEV